MTKHIIHTIIFLVIGLALASCGTEMSNSISGKDFAFGKAGKVAVLVDENLCEGAPGDTMEFYYETAYPILPQPEPLMDLQHQTYDDLIQKPIRKNLRSYIVLANLSDKESLVTKMVQEDLGEKLYNGMKDKDYMLQSGKNKWAQNQLILYIIGKDESALIDGIKASLPTFSRRLYEFDKIQYEANLFLSGHQVTIQNKLKEYYNISMDIPDRYKMGVDKKPFVWIQHITPKITSGLVFYELPYKNQAQFSEENMVALRDSLTRKHITSSAKGSFMRVDNVNLPTFHYQREIDGNYASELRGIWTMENEFMGGAFTSFLIHHPKLNKVIFIDGFVYGPGQKKREAMKQLIYLIEGVKMSG